MVQSELDAARIARGANNAEVGRALGADGVFEVQAAEGVEGLQAHLSVVPLA